MTIWVVGDVMLDTWIRGEALRVAPDAPVPVVRVTGRASSPGGAAHVARSARALGSPVVLAGVVGDDADGAALTRLFAGEGIDTAGLVVASDRVTTVKTRVVASEQQLVRYDVEETGPVAEAATEAMIAALERAAPPAAIVASDYGKGVLTPRLFGWLAGLAARLGVPLLVDPKGRDFSRYAGATLLTPNARELEDAAGAAVDLDDDRTLAAAAARVANGARRDRHPRRAGRRGLEPGRAVRARPGAGNGRRGRDVAGAGDTLIASVAVGLAGGLGIREAVALANHAAGLAAERPGVALVARGELAPRAREAVTRDELDARLAAWRLRGDRVVFTNGCFDLLHAGHVALLERAASFGDVLVVGLNGDDSVRRLKGPTRPFNPAAERAAVLAALACVDAVVLFDQDTPLELISVVRPHVLVKGADYKLEEVVGRAEVEAAGGRVELVALVPARLTTRLVERVRGSE